MVVFVRRPDDADGIAKGIQKKLTRFPDAVEVLTGTMRGLERDELLAKRVFQRFLDVEEKPEERAEKGPCVLAPAKWASTSTPITWYATRRPWTQCLNNGLAFGAAQSDGCSRPRRERNKTGTSCSLPRPPVWRE